MNLVENIQRIKQMMGLLIEEDKIKFPELKKISLNYDPEVEELQKFLKSKDYDLGNFGPNKDGVDGKYGKITKLAHKYYLSGISSENFNLKQKEKSNDKIDDKSDNQSISSGVDVILMGGLDYRSGDKNITQQVELLKSNMGNKNVIGYRYNDFNGVKSSLLKHPDSYVVLFSAGCSYSSKIADLINNKSKLFIVEPFASSSNTAGSVQGAVSKGVPNSNVITGPTTSRGLGVVSGATKTPSGVNHWGALKFVGGLIK